MIDGEVMVKGVDFNTSSGLIRTKYVKSKNYDFHDGDWDLKSKTTPFRLDPDHIKVVVYGIVDLDVINDPKAEGLIHSVTDESRGCSPSPSEILPGNRMGSLRVTPVFDLESLVLYQEEAFRRT
ncbi:DNA ligase [Enterobacter phage 04_vB_Eclo_IJM]|nr:DNA ligase [Enterobacter phage 04_vB_Eclo_IJM]